MEENNLVDIHEVICDKCGGVGSVIVKYNYYKHNHTRAKCPKCKGTGKLDWIERIIGRKACEKI